MKWERARQRWQQENDRGIKQRKKAHSTRPTNVYPSSAPNDTVIDNVSDDVLGVYRSVFDIVTLIRETGKFDMRTYRW